MDLLPIQLGMKYCSIWVSSLWIYTHFEQYFMPGRISNSTGRIRPGKKYCSNWVEILGFTPNSTGHKLLVKLGGNSLRLHHRLMKNKNKVTQYI